LSTSSRDGDTFETLSRRFYGTEKHADVLKEANPGKTEPFLEGTKFFVPPIQGYSKNTPEKVESTNQDEVSILIDGVRFRFWTSITIETTLDSVDKISFFAPFDADVFDYRKVFKPFSYKKVVVNVGGELVFTGTMMAVNPVITPDSKSFSISCYSTPGVLNDCNPSPSSYPIEFDGQRIKDIANKLCRPFGINVIYEAPIGPIFERVSCGTTSKILGFLSGLAAQRNSIITNNEKGDLVFKQSVKTGEPVAILKQSQSPVVEIKHRFRPQAYYSDVVGVEPIGLQIPSLVSSSLFPAKNKFLTEAYRPQAFRINDALNPNNQEIANTKLARMFANVASFDVTVSTWRDSKNNQLWQPNTTVILNAPDSMVYNDYEFIIRRVSFFNDSSSRTATLNLVMPGVFSGQLPDKLPWDD
jgi:prophage tail gpP-like protein